jgi:DNA-binding transcriptional LysR family regulator
MKDGNRPQGTQYPHAARVPARNGVDFAVKPSVTLDPRSATLQPSSKDLRKWTRRPRGMARTLGMTQPTVGRQIDALEESLGVALFTRSLDGLAPTDTALRLVGSAEAMAGAVESAQRAASGEPAEERGTVRVTASEVIGGEVLPPILAAFHALHPLIKLELVLTNRNEDLLRGEAEILAGHACWRSDGVVCVLPKQSQRY